MTAVWVLGYFAVGYGLGFIFFLFADPRPGHRLPIWQRIPAQAVLISSGAAFWPLTIIAFALHRFQKFDPGESVSHHDYERDSQGRINLSKQSPSVELYIIGILILWAFVIGIWLQEQQISGLLVLGILLATLFTVYSILLLVKPTERTDGLRLENEALTWNYQQGWSTATVNVPLKEIVWIKLLVTDPLFNQEGLLIVLQEGASSPGWLPEELQSSKVNGEFPKWLDVDPLLPQDLLVILSHDLWDWEPRKVAAWLQSEGILNKSEDSIGASL